MEYHISRNICTNDLTLILSLRQFPKMFKMSFVLEVQHEVREQRYSVNKQKPDKWLFNTLCRQENAN